MYRIAELARYVVLLIGFALLTLSSGAAGCGEDDDGPTGPKLKTCAEATFVFIGGSSLPRINFPGMPCSGGLNETLTGTSSDQFGRTTSYTYSIQCSDGSNRQTASVTNITYNNLGQAVSWNFTVNGANCGQRTGAAVPTT